MVTIGRLRVHLVEATLTHDTEFLGKMDPFVKMKCREQEWKSSVMQDAGKHPVWHSQFFDINVHYFGDDLEIIVMDEDVTTNDLVGSGVHKLSSLVVDGHGMDEWFEIQYKGKSAGRVHLKCEWEAAHGHHH